jgi:hypothetical protein
MALPDDGRKHEQVGGGIEPEQEILHVCRARHNTPPTGIDGPNACLPRHVHVRHGAVVLVVGPDVGSPPGRRHRRIVRQ